MVRTGNLSKLVVSIAAIFAFNLSSARAEDPLEWYAALRRVAKYSRIDAFRGAPGTEAQSYAAELAQLAPRIDTWSKPPGSDRAKGVCLYALRNLEVALKVPRAPDRHDAIVLGEPLRDDCQRAIWGQ